VPNNGQVNLSGNYLTGGASVHLDMRDWLNAAVSGNMFYSTGGRATTLQRPAGGSYNWSGNSYYDQTAMMNCVGGNRRATYGYNGQSGQCGGALDFLEWKTLTGFDGGSVYNSTAPQGQVVIRPNRYQAGRAHIIVYNWSSSSTVSVNVAGLLQVGDSYEIRNAQNYNGPLVLSGTYSGGSLSVPVTGLTVATPIGYDFTAAPTGPKFNVFVLIKR
jgi:hypothetical protein